MIGIVTEEIPYKIIENSEGVPPERVEEQTFFQMYVKALTLTGLRVQSFRREKRGIF